MDYSKLIQFATVRQIEYIEAIERHGTQRAAAKALGINQRTLERSIGALRVKAAVKGWSPEHDYTHPVPPGQMLRGVSTYYDPEGKIKGQWVMSKADTAAQEAIMREAIAAMCEDIPKMPPAPCPANVSQSLCNVYTLTDSHVGALAWDVETKSGDWDLGIAEKTLVGCFAAMVEASPKAGTCVIAQLGDFLHYDSAIAATTPMHGNILDADGRMPKMVRAAIRILRTVIGMALAKHQRVVVLLAEGNHDISSSVWLRAMFQAMYENEPRLEVIDSELPYYTHQHGETMLAWHHGHLKKPHELPILFAAQFPKVWGGTTKRYCHTGHRHHVEEKEHSGMTVIQHPTLAARDAYAARGGWIAERQVTSITYSDKFGQVARNTVTPEMLQE
jgi:hypothetical protein